MSKHPPSAQDIQTLSDWNRLLHESARKGDLDAMAEALVNGADIDYREGDNRTPVMHCAINATGGGDHRYAVCKFLLDAGADPNAANRRGFSILHLLANGNQDDLVDLLLDYGANPNVYSKTGSTPPDYETPLHEGARKNRNNVVLPLLHGGADPSLPDMNGRSVAQSVPEMYMDILTKLYDFEQLPRISPESEFTKADLLRKENGACALDNPLTWRDWRSIDAKLSEQGEAFSKAELMQAGKDGAPYLLTATRARALDATVEGLNRNGESLSVRELLAADEGFAQHLARHHAPNALFTEENMVLQPEGAVQSNFVALPADGQAELHHVHRLAASLRVAANVQERGR